MTGANANELPHEGEVLGRIHAGANERKARAYWIGFLRGVLSSGSIETMELMPLRAEAEVFLANLRDESAASLIDDLDAGHCGDGTHLMDIVGRAEATRSRGFRVETHKDAVNELYGFCAGIACDNRITPAEVETLLSKIAATPDLLEDGRIRSLEWAARRSIEDGRITEEESEDICSWIARLVGDSCTDTGLATFGNVGVIDGSLRDHAQVLFPDRMFVLTGKFSIGPRKVVAGLVEERGGVGRTSSAPGRTTWSSQSLARAIGYTRTKARKSFEPWRSATAAERSTWLRSRPSPQPWVIVPERRPSNGCRRHCTARRTESEPRNVFRPTNHYVRS